MRHTPAILITGASGFVGKLLAREEIKRGNRVLGIHHPAENPDLEFTSVGIDLRDRDKLKKLLFKEKPDRVYHLAALSSVRMCQENPVLAFDTNVIGTLNLVDLLSELHPKSKILFTSSCEVYGKIDETRLPVGEETSPRPINVYGLSKLQAEGICRYFHRNYALPVFITRAFNHTGPGQAPTFVLPHVASTLARIKAGKDEPLLKMGNLSTRRDFLDARDVVSAYMTVMDKAEAGTNYNVTSGRLVSIEQAVRMLVEISGLQVKIFVDETRMRSYDIPVLSGDASRLAEDLGWQARIPLEQTLRDLFKYWLTKEGEL